PGSPDASATTFQVSPLGRIVMMWSPSSAVSHPTAIGVPSGSSATALNSPAPVARSTDHVLLRNRSTSGTVLPPARTLHPTAYSEPSGEATTPFKTELPGTVGVGTTCQP